MAVLRKIFGTSVAIAVALTICASSGFAQARGAAPAGAPAQGGGRGGRGAAPYTPAAGAKD
jgi:hypothetical protein